MSSTIGNVYRAIKNKHFRASLVAEYHRRQRILYVDSRELRDIIYDKRFHRTLWKKYGPSSLSKYAPPVEEPPHPIPIWMCWFQGFESAPPIVRACRRSFERAMPKDTYLRCVSLDDVRQLCNIPDSIWDKYERGVIPNAHLSDIVRLELLIKYGGVWADATVFRSPLEGNNSLPSYMTREHLFMYANAMSANSAIVTSSWFIYATPQHPLLMLTRDLIYNYWSKENLLLRYFTFHICFTEACARLPQYWTVPTVSNVPPHLLGKELERPYDATRWNELCQMSAFHKLTHHRDAYDSQSIYEHLVNLD